MKNLRLLFILLSLCTYFYSSGQKGAIKKKDEKLGLDISVKHGQLSNGFTYYLKDNDSKVTHFFLVVKTGSEMENFDQIEYAHVLEHTGMNSTKNFPDVNDFSKISGRSIFARTGRYHTGYYINIPSEDKEGIELGIQLIRDWAQNINVDQKNIDKARGAVLGEMRVKDYHQRLWTDKIDSVLINTTNFSSLERKKNKENVQNFDRPAFLRFYKEWYRPDLQAVIIVGDIDLNNIELQVEQMFSDLEIPENSGKGYYKKINKKKIVLNGKNQFLTLTDTVKPNFRIEFFSKRINAAYQANDKSNFKKLLLQELYEGILETRSQRMSEKYDPVFNSFRPNYSVISAYEQLYVSSMSVELKNDDPNYIRNKFQSALTAWKQMHENITPAELDVEKENLLHNSDFGDMSSSAIAFNFQDHFVYGTPALHPEEEKRIMLELLDDISLEEITEFTTAYGDFSKNTDFIFINDGNSKIPSIETRKKWVSEIIEKKVPPLDKATPAIKSLSETINLPNDCISYIKSDHQNSIGINTVVLKNGIKLILKSTKASSDFYSNTVSIKAVQTNTIPHSNREDYIMAQIIPEITTYMGGGSYTRFDLDRFKRNKNIRFRMGANKDFQFMEGSANIENVDELLSLIYLYINQPRRDSLALETWRTRKLEYMNGNNPRASSDFFLEDIQNIWYSEVPKLTTKDLKDLTIQKTHKYQKQWLKDLSNYTFIVTGNYDLEKLKPILIKYISKFPVLQDNQESKLPDFNFPLKKMNEIIRLANLNQILVQLYFPSKISTDIKSQVYLKLISKAFHDRIEKRLNGTSYVPRAWGEWMNKKKGIYSFNINFDSKLGNEQNTVQVALDEFMQLKNNGVNQKWLDTAIEDELMRFNYNTNNFGLHNFWLTKIEESILNNTDLEKEILNFEAIIRNSISLNELNTMINDVLTTDYLQQFMVIPEEYNFKIN